MGSKPEANYMPHMVLIPYPFQSHIKTMLKLAKLLHSKGFHITFVNTEFNHQRFLKSRGPDALDGLPHFRFETIPDGLPPSHIDASQETIPLAMAVENNMLAPLKVLLAKLDNPPITCLVSDVFLRFTITAAEELGLPIVMLVTMSACGYMGFKQLHDLREKGFLPLKDESYLTNGYLETTIIEGIPGMKPLQLKDFPYTRTIDPDDFPFNFVMRAAEASVKAHAIAIHTFDALEQDVLDGLSTIFPRVYSIGPLQLLLNQIQQDGLSSVGYNLWKEDSECLQWLDTKEPKSVVYVNFGSIAVMTAEQLVEFAMGLANSEISFLWIIRPDLVTGESAILPAEFQVDTQNRGFVTSWCPQEEVLNHPSVGGFLTHTGWNSIIESLCAGVPVICWPLFADQPINCSYACIEWGVGMEIDNNVRREEVEKLIRNLMGGEECKKMRENKPSLSRHVSTRSFPSIRGSRSSVSMESSSPEPTVSLDSVTQDLKNQTLGPDDVSKAKLKLEDLNWDHSFVRALPGDPRADTIPRQVMHACYTKVLPSAEVENPELVAWSDSVADLFDLDPKEFERPDFPLLFSGASPLVGALPYAQCYGGHQFGMWAGQLGDGRAITLGEVVNSKSERWELQLKGSGRTPYSRFADGLAVLRSSIREFLCSEAMHCLGIPTTRALSLVTTGKYVTRDMFYDGNAKEEPGAIVCRVAPSFLRFGSYQIHASRGKEDLEIVRALADYAIRHHFPHIENMNKSESLSFSTGDEDHSVVDLTSNKYAAWTVEIAERTASMIASWQGVGFTHGVMNTDNMSILGLTIDYGPFGFLDAFDPSFTPNTTDLPGRRYCFANQPDIGLWNIAQFTATLSTAKLINDKEADYAMERYGNKFMDEYQAMMTRKLGLPKYNKQLINKLLNNMAVDKVDYTNFFRLLSNVKADPKIPEDELLVPLKAVLLDIGQERKVAWISWVQSYVHELAASGISDEQRKAQMDSVNPKYVLRNYLCQTAIDAAEQGDYREVRRLLKLMERPYDEQPGMEKYARLPPAWAYRPGVCMLSCSS